MGHNISALEGRNGGRDWKLIVEAVPCPTCGAKDGEPCVNVSMTNPMFASAGKVRIDWHSTRKEFAANAWYNGREEGVDENKIAPLIAGEMQQEPAPPIPDKLPVDNTVEGVVEAKVTTKKKLANG